MPDPFYSRKSLNVDIYQRRTATSPVVEGDTEFYLELAREAPGPALELGCGTARLVLPLAQAGFDVTGLDASDAMLAVAAERVAKEPEAVQARVRLVRGDMADFELGQRFGFVFSAFRSFMMLTTPEAQRASLERVWRHLLPGGLLAIDIFDPQLDRLVPESPGEPRSLGNAPHPASWNLVGVEWLSRVNDPLSQVFEEVWRFTEVARDGSVVRMEEESLRMRWTYRYEMRYLLELCGFEVLAEYSDYDRSPPAYGKEQVWVARRSEERGA